MTDRYAPHPGAAWRNVEGHVFIIGTDGRHHELFQSVSVLMWEACAAAPCTEADLLQTVLSEFDVDKTTASADLQLFLQDAVQKGILAQIRPLG